MKPANINRKITLHHLAFLQQAVKISMEDCAVVKNLMHLDRPPPSC